jgi:hypothetical protein
VKTLVEIRGFFIYKKSWFGSHLKFVWQSYYICPVFYIIKWTYFCQTKSYHACSSSTRCTRSTNKRCTTCTRSTRCTDIPTICLANTYYTSPDAQRMRKMLFGSCQSISATPQQRVICITYVDNYVDNFI